MHRVAILLAMLAALAGCGSTGVYRDTSVPISSAAAFDPTRYVGRWYEIARFPVLFQAGCVAVTAAYALREDGRLQIENSCREGALDGPVRRIVGEARITGPGRLSVGFDTVPLIRAPYWVLWVDEGYRTAVVGVPSGRAGWILNRTPEIPEDRLKAALEVLEFNGYDVSRLQYTPQTALARDLR